MIEDIKDIIVFIILPVAFVFSTIVSLSCYTKFNDPFCWVRGQCYASIGTNNSECFECRCKDYGTIKLEGDKE